MYRTLSLLLLLAVPAAAQRAPIRHVFTIILENKSFDETFGPQSAASYLSTQLTAQGELLTNYYATGHNSLPNYIALVSGQAPNVIAQGDCQVYQDFVPSSPVQVEANGQTVGQGCVFPSETQTIADQLTAHQYAAQHNPFVYFHSIIDGPSCPANDVPLTQLPIDLKHYATTPNYVLITPNLCHDGHDSPCVDGEPGGLVSASCLPTGWIAPDSVR